MTRKNQPEAVRKSLIEAAKKLTIKHGWDKFSLDAVAKMSGISKGGLIHHFPSKQALLDAIADEILLGIDRKINGLMARDPNPEGRFIRAYLRLAFENEDSEYHDLLVAVTVASTHDHTLTEKWDAWFETKFPASEQTAKSLIIKFAIDGIWFSSLFKNDLSEEKKHAVKERLLEFSQTTI